MAGRRNTSARAQATQIPIPVSALAAGIRYFTKGLQGKWVCQWCAKLQRGQTDSNMSGMTRSRRRHQCRILNPKGLYVIRAPSSCPRRVFELKSSRTKWLASRVNWYCLGRLLYIPYRIKTFSYFINIINVIKDNVPNVLINSTIQYVKWLRVYAMFLQIDCQCCGSGPESGAFLTPDPGSGIGFFPGSRIPKTIFLSASWQFFG